MTTTLNGRNVTVRNSPLSSGVSAHTPAERETAPEVSTVHSKLATLRDRAEGAVGRSRAYWVPPNLLTRPPASVAELAAYAHRAGWTRSTAGSLRALGVLWHRAVGLPVTVLCRYVEWFAQRPARALVAFGVWQMTSRSVPGSWIADHLIRPILAAAAWVFLP